MTDRLHWQGSAPSPHAETTYASSGAALRGFPGSGEYDLGMSDRKMRITVTLDPALIAYAEQLVQAGKAPSVSAVVNDALTSDRLRDQRSRRLWKEASEHADEEKVARMRAHVDAQLAQLPESHRYR